MFFFVGCVLSTQNSQTNENRCSSSLFFFRAARVDSIGVVNDGAQCGAAPLVCSTDAYNPSDKSQASKLAELSGYNVLGFSPLSDIGGMRFLSSQLHPLSD